jgi:RNA polymerase sigma factor (sigma-70 family)
MHANTNVIEIGHASTAGAGRFAWPDDGLSDFMSVRPRLFNIAYRMLGNAAEAEDIVQDVWLRWQTTDRTAIRNPLAFLVTATTRLAINVLQSARTRRETSASSVLPEPVDTSADASLQTEQDEALNAAVLLLLETLSPVERAAYVLREAFSYPYREIARITRVQEANARQLVTRARARVSGERRVSGSPMEQRRLRDAFVAASRTGDLVILERLFASELPLCPSLSQVSAPVGHFGGTRRDTARLHEV